MLFLIDCGLARVLKLFHEGCPSGDIREMNYALKKSSEDIIFIGSSRARHHFVPSIFEDSLGLNSYNAGMNGKGIFYHYCILGALVDRRVPKIIVLDLTENDLITSERFGLATLRVLAPHYNYSPRIDSVLELGGWSKRVKLQSGLYRFNSEISEIISGYYLTHESQDGYKPLRGTSNMQLIAKPNEDNALDSLKLRYIKKFFSLAKRKGIRLFVTLSPSYHVSDMNREGFKALRRLCDEYSVPVFDYSADEFFLSNPSLFKDPRHLNHEGATEYSRRLAQRIGRLLISNEAI